MKQHYALVVASAAIWLMSACATSNNAANETGPGKVYTHEEYSKMTYCVGMADTAMYVATNKLKGTSMQQMRDYYASKPNSRLPIATVEKVYGDTFSSAWDYTVSFFNECAQNLASVPASRVNLASYCNQNALIAGVAHAYKTSGAPKERAYAAFAAFKSSTPNSVVDKVYASAKNRAEIKLEIWNACMAEISAAK